MSKTPLPDRENFTFVEDWHCQIIGGALIIWLEQISPQFLQERQVLSKALSVDPEPFIVFTSDFSGLASARDIVGSENERLSLISRYANDASSYRYTWRTTGRSLQHSGSSSIF